MLDLNGAMWIFTNYLPIIIIILAPAYLLYNKSKSYNMALLGANAGVVLGYMFGSTIITLQIVILAFFIDVLIIYPKIKQYIPGADSN